MQIRCPHCHHPVEVVDEKLLEDVTCPSCGSNISLVSAASTAAHTPSSAETSSLDGRQRLGHFELLSQVGLGGFGAVWKARDTVLDRIVALKIPRRGQLDPSETEYFLRDARAAAQLRHPSIVRVYEVGRDGDTVFIASDFIEGANLKEWLSERPMTVREAAEFVAQIADAVQHAHERGIVHRDLKPGNILMDHEDRPHLTDFGLAKRETGEITMTVDGQILGTPAYMSPEQARGKAHEADAASDVYSLGVILFELLTGELPFRGEKRMLMLQILNDEPPSPRKLNGRVPRDLETICLKCLQKEPKRRFGIAKALAEDLRRFLRGESIMARPISRAERTQKWIKRHPTFVVMSALLAAVTLFGLASTTWLWRRAEDSLAKSESSRYANQIALANFELLLDDRDRSRGILKQCKSDLRGWEWNYLKRRSAPLLAEWENARSAPNDVALSKDGRLLATAHRENVAIIWDVMTGNLIQSFAHDRPAHTIRFNGDGTRVVTASGTSESNDAVDDGLVTVWDARTGGKIRTREQLGGGSSRVAITGDGKRVVSLDRNERIVLWQVADGAAITQFPVGGSALTEVAFSPDERQLAVTINGTVNLVDVPSNKIAGILEDERDTAWASSGVFAYSATGRTLATSERIWDSKTGMRLARYTPDGPVADISYSPAQDQFAFIGTIPSPGGGGGGTAVKFVGSRDGVVHHVLNFDSEIFDRIAFSADGRVSVLVCAQPRNGSSSGQMKVTVFDGLAGSNPMLFEKGELPVDEIVPSPSDRYLAVRGRIPREPSLYQAIDPPQPGEVTVLATDTGRVALKLPLVGTRRALAMSPDGTRVAASGPGRVVTIYELSTGKEVLTLDGNAADVRAIAFRTDGKQLATASDDHVVRIWDTQDGKELHRLIYEGSLVEQISFQRAGRYIAGSDFVDIKEVLGKVTGMSDSYRVHIWDIDSHDPLDIKPRKPLDFNVKASAGIFDHAGERLLTVDGTRTVVWHNVPKWSQTEPALDNNKTEATASLRCIAMSSDDQWLAFGLEDGQVRIVNLSRGDTRTIGGGPLPTGLGGRRVMGLGGRRVTALAFSPDGKQLAWASRDRGEIHFFELDGSRQRSLSAHKDGVCALVWTPDKQQLVSGSYDQTLKLWDVGSGKMVRQLGEPLCGHAMAWHPDRDVLAVAGWDDIVRIWDVEKQNVQALLSGFGSRIRAIAWSSDGKSVAGAGGGEFVIVWDTATQQIARRLASQSPSLVSVAWSPDGRRIAAQGADRSVHIWDGNSEERIARVEPRISGGSSQQLTAPLLHWSVDSNYLVVGTGTSNESPSGIELIDALMPENAPYNDSNAKAIAWQPGTRQFTLTDGSACQLIDADTQSVIWQHDSDGRFYQQSPLAFSPNGRRLIATRGVNFNVYDANTGEELLALQNPGEDASQRDVQKRISRLAFSHSGDMLFVGSMDGAVRCYNGTPLKRTSSMPAGPVDVSKRAVAILTGKVVATAAKDDHADIWVSVESIQKDDFDEFTAGDSLAVRLTKPPFRLFMHRVRLYLASKSYDDVSKSEVWTTVSPGDSVVLLDGAPSP